MKTAEPHFVSVDKVNWRGTMCGIEDKDDGKDVAVTGQLHLVRCETCLDRLRVAATNTLTNLRLEGL